MNRIDAHHHLWDLGQRDPDWLKEPALQPIRKSYLLDDLVNQTDMLNVDHTVVVQSVGDIDETFALLEQAEQSGGLIAGVVGWVDLSGDVADQIDRLQAADGGRWLVGIRHQVQDEEDPAWLARPDVLRGLQAVAERGLVYDLLVFPHQLPAAIHAVRAVTDGRFVLDHAAKPDLRHGDIEQWARDIRELSGNRNVACKLSGLVTEADWNSWEVEDLRPVADHVLETFGPDRVMVGSDWPVCELAATYRQVWDAAERLVAKQDIAQVFADTATRWYGLQLVSIGQSSDVNVGTNS